jgi:hypothetical protein
MEHASSDHTWVRPARHVCWRGDSSAVGAPALPCLRRLIARWNQAAPQLWSSTGGPWSSTVDDGTAGSRANGAAGRGLRRRPGCDRGRLALAADGVGGEHRRGRSAASAEGPRQWPRWRAVPCNCGVAIGGRIRYR